MLYLNSSSKLCIFRSNQTIAGRHSAYCSSLINSRTEKRNFEYNCIDLTLNTFLLTIEEGKEVLFCQSSFDYTSYLYNRVQYCRQKPEMKYFFYFSFTFCLGVSGNILIILTVMKKSSFKSPTNTFLASLATADLLLIVICLPVKVRTRLKRTEQ